MDPIVWSSSLETGNHEVDEQHRELFARVNALVAASNSGHASEVVLSLLLFLGEYVVEHFAEEEALAKDDCQLCAINHEEHQTFASAYADLEARIGRATLDDPRVPDELIAALETKVTQWLRDHVLRIDVHFGNH